MRKTPPGVGLSQADFKAAMNLYFAVARSGDIASARRALNLYGEFLRAGIVPDSGHEYIVRQCEWIIERTDNPRSQRIRSLLERIRAKDLEALRVAVDDLKAWTAESELAAQERSRSQKAREAGAQSRTSRAGIDTSNVCRRFDQILAAGRERHEIASIIAKELGVTSRSIRTHLKEGGRRTKKSGS